MAVLLSPHPEEAAAASVSKDAPSLPRSSSTRPATAAFLGVERSLLGRQWRASGGDDRLALALSQRLGLPEVLGRILAARGIDLVHAPSFLDPKLRDLLPDPSQFKDMDVAAERLARAVREGEG